MQVPATSARYFDVKVLEPAVRPVIQNVALIELGSPLFLPFHCRACVSAAETVELPETTNPMRHPTPFVEVSIVAVNVTIALPDAGIVSVAEGPAVARSV